MANIKLTIEYAGTPYSGWQYQKDEKTVQGEIEKAIFKFSGEKKTIQGAGRTDAGVHALAQCANFNLDKKFTDYQILNGLNFHLGNEKIKISKVENVSEDFNARFSKNKKTYFDDLSKDDKDLTMFTVINLNLTSRNQGEGLAMNIVLKRKATMELMTTYLPTLLLLLLTPSLQWTYLFFCLLLKGSPSCTFTIFAKLI